MCDHMDERPAKHLIYEASLHPERDGYKQCPCLDGWFTARLGTAGRVLECLPVGYLSSR